MEDKIFTKEDADLFLDNCGVCMMEDNKEIFYLAAVINQKKKDSYLIEIGYFKECKLPKNQNYVTFSDVYLYCSINAKSSSLLKNNRKAQKRMEHWLITNKKIPSIYNEIDPVKLQNFDNVKVRPLMAGIEIGGVIKKKTGTLGAILHDEGGYYALTNLHVLFDVNKNFDNESTSRIPVFQPNLRDNKYENYIGNYQFGYFGNTVFDDGIEYFEYSVDFALIYLKDEDNEFTDANNNTFCTRHFIGSRPRENYQDPSILGICPATLDTSAKLHGKKTGKSETKKIRSINCLVKIFFDELSTCEEIKLNNSYTYFKRQILTDCLSIPGDSGSVLVNNNNYAVGLLFAGDGKTVSFSNNLDLVKNSSFTAGRQTMSIKSLNFLT